MSAQSYPKWKYHKDESAKIVHSQDEAAALGPSWVDSPADVRDSPDEDSQTLALETVKLAPAPRRRKS